MNITQARRLVKLLKVTVRTPISNFNMERWVGGNVKANIATQIKKPDCGTTLCFWGHAPIAWPKDFEWKGEYVSKVGEVDQRCSLKYFFQEFFGISRDQASILFFNCDLDHYTQLSETVFKVLNSNGYKCVNGKVERMLTPLNSL